MSSYSGIYCDYVETITYGCRILGMNAPEIARSLDDPAGPSLTMIRYIIEKEGLKEPRRIRRKKTKLILAWNTWTPEMQYKYDTL